MISSDLTYQEAEAILQQLAGPSTWDRLLLGTGWRVNFKRVHRLTSNLILT